MQSIHFMLVLVSSIFSSRILTSDQTKDDLYLPCSSYISTVSDYTCDRELNIGINSYSSHYLVKNSEGQKFVMKVQKKSEMSEYESKVLEDLKDIESVVNKKTETFSDNLHIIVMQYAPRKSLEMVLQTTDHFWKLKNIMNFFLKLLKVLKKIHEKGYIPVSYTHLTLPTILLV